MANVLSNWYHTHYAAWRTRRFAMPQFLADPNARLQMAARDAVVINMGDLVQEDPSKKKQDTLFGPAIGAVNPGPDWATSTESQSTVDELTPEIVKGWISKSKDPSQPTTTLQALVNLKRPTLRLSPLTDDPSHHAVEFQFDCDAPKCSIQVHVLPHSHSSTSPANPMLIYETVVDGGFGKTLKLEDEATLELSKYEYKPGQLKQNQPGASNHDLPSSSTHAESSAAGAASAAESSQAKKRFSTFPFRKRNPNQASRSTVTAGPSLQVVDEQATPSADGTASSKQDSSDEEGVRVTIRLEALSESSQSLASPNTQVTYLHIVRMGTEKEEENRPWVVKVVKREATIGPHTFHLHEIYGLTTATATPAGGNHSYPPSGDQNQGYDFAGQECVLCLSSPREVVLLPCRHLVACKECAVNMVEFGAGGTLHQAAETTPAAPAAPGGTDDATAADGDTPGTEGQPDATASQPGAAPAQANGAPTAAPATAAAPPAAPRRKRKPKGWFCPVCRQPYTSLLRITTTPPDVKAMRHSEDDAELAPAAPAPVANAVVPPTATPPASAVMADLAGGPRPVSFLRSFSRASIRALSGNTPAPNTPPTVAEVPVSAA